MGRGYKTSQAEFLNYVYQPNYDLELKLAQEAVNEDALKKSFSSMTEFNGQPTFGAWQEELDNEVSILNQELDPIVETLIKDPYSTEGMRQLKDIKAKAKDMYSSGKIGKMANHYNHYYSEIEKLEKEIETAKGPEKANLRDRLNKYKGYAARQINKGYSDDFNLNELSPHVDAQLKLRDNINTENLKYAFKNFNNTSEPVIELNGQIQAVPPGYAITKGKDGKNYATSPDGELHPVGTYQSLLVKKFPGMDFKNYYSSTETEGFQQDTINTIAQNTLYSDPGFTNMVRQDFFDFGYRMEGLEGETEEEQFRSYLDKRVQMEAGNFAGQHPKVTKSKEDIIELNDDFGKQITLSNHKHELSKALETHKASLKPTEGNKEWENLEDQVTVFSTKKFRLFDEPNLEAVSKNLELLKNKKAKGTITPEEEVKLQQSSVIYETALDYAQIKDEKLLEILRKDAEDPNWGITTKSDQLGEHQTYTTITSDERKEADAYKEKFKDQLEKVNKSIADQSVFELSAIKVPEVQLDKNGGEIKNPLRRVLATEFDALVKDDYAFYNPDYLPYVIEGNNSNTTKPIDVKKENGVDFINSIAEENGIRPNEVFVPGTLKRFERDGKIFYSGKIKEEYGTVEDGDDNNYQEVVMHMGRNSTNVLEIMDRHLGNNPEMQHIYQMATNPYYAHVFDTVELQQSVIEGKMAANSKDIILQGVKGTPIKVPGSNKEYSITYFPRSGMYELYENGVPLTSDPDIQMIKHELYYKSIGQ